MFSILKEQLLQAGNPLDLHTLLSTVVSEELKNGFEGNKSSISVIPEKQVGGFVDAADETVVDLGANEDTETGIFEADMVADMAADEDCCFGWA